MPYSYLTKHHLYDFDQLMAHLGVRPGHQVLDLGCGHHGFWTFPMAQTVGRTGEVHAIDICPAAVKNIKRKSAELRLKHVNPVWADLEKLKNADLPKSDIALLVNTLYQIKKKPTFLSAISSLLKPQGKLLIVDWKVNSNSYGPPSDQRITEEDMKKWTKRAKLDTLKELYLDDDHFAKVLLKI